MAVIVRFAPSPTGRIHIGNARTALINWLVARKNGGTFILRYDDTDRERSTEEFAKGIARDLAWLGIAPDQTTRQSDRLAFYDTAAERLKEAGRLYPCYETPDELERKRKRQLARHQPPVYDRAALKLTAEEKAGLEADGRKPHWRFLLEQRAVRWNDLVRGEQGIDAGSLSDPVLIRGDGTYLYTFTSVVDDIDMGVTHIIRGEDHVTNTGVQIELFEALDGTAPAFAHHSLLVGASGEALSKRLGSLSIEGLRNEGFEAMAVASLATLIGTSEPVAPHATMDELAGIFDLGKLSRAPARFDPSELASLNAKLLHQLDHDAVKVRLAELGLAVDEQLWLAIRGNLEKLAGAADWAQVVNGAVQPVVEDADYLEQAAGLLPAEPWSASTWSSWTTAIKEATGRKGRALFHPLRLALTGRETGPELAALLPLMGRALCLARLSGRPA